MTAYKLPLGIRTLPRFCYNGVTVKNSTPPSCKHTFWARFTKAQPDYPVGLLLLSVRPHEIIIANFQRSAMRREIGSLATTGQIVVFALLRRITVPMSPRPARSIAQDSGSGIGLTLLCVERSKFNASDPVPAPLAKTPNTSVPDCESGEECQ